MGPPWGARQSSPKPSVWSACICVRKCAASGSRARRQKSTDTCSRGARVSTTPSDMPPLLCAAAAVAAVRYGTHRHSGMACSSPRFQR